VVRVVTTVVGGRQHQDGVQPQCQQGCALVFFAQPSGHVKVEQC
jgi:hypothetical protein